MVAEAELQDTDTGLVPEGEGWFVVNAREARWYEHDEFGRWTRFESETARFPELGINVSILEPGKPSCMYHREENQEDFLVLAGDCKLLVEGEERPLKAWDFVHCPAWTDHVFVGGSTPCLIVAMGTRTGEGLHYPVDELAQRYGAGVLEATDSGDEAYARFGRPRQIPHREGDLPECA
jgi:uncharacterized cupin superfamily protein